jgi:hypothetical protein
MLLASSFLMVLKLAPRGPKFSDPKIQSSRSFPWYMRQGVSGISMLILYASHHAPKECRGKKPDIQICKVNLP